MIPGVTEPFIQVSKAEQFWDWLSANAESASVIWAVILKKSTGRQTVTMDQLLEVAICWGWIDVRTKSVDDQQYGIRFVPRKSGGNWTAANRSIACRLIAEGRMQPSGKARLPEDLDCSGTAG